MARGASIEDMRRIRDDFVRAAHAAASAGFDWLELHCAHGYLLSSFISPLTNQRTDEYGGSLENRCRYPLEVFAAIRAVWPQDRPISVRVSAHDWCEGGVTPGDAVEVARLFKAAGADMIDCSSGQVTKQEKPVYGRMFQAPFSDRIRDEAGIPTIAVGAIYEADHANSIIASGRADLCAVARPHLANPAWTLTETARIGYTGLAWPKQYYAAKVQLERNLERGVDRRRQQRPDAAAGRGKTARRLTHTVIGQGRAADLLFSGRSIGGEEAERWGFFNRLCEPRAVLGEAQAFASSLAQGPTFAHAMTKKMMQQEWNMGVDEAIEAEAQAQAICMATNDFHRAYHAFAAKQKPQFEGN